VIYSDSVRAGRQAVNPELSEQIRLDCDARAFHYDVGTRQVPSVQAVGDYTHNLRLASFGPNGRRSRRGFVLGAKRQRNTDESDRYEELKLPEHSDQSPSAGWSTAFCTRLCNGTDCHLTIATMSLSIVSRKAGEAARLEQPRAGELVGVLCCRFRCRLTPTLSDIARGELRQITLSVNDLQISFRTLYSRSVA
jgi:hypothetical protein